jgi:hypothetical protein
MTNQAQTELGRTLWNIADTLRGAMTAGVTCRRRGREKAC